LVLLLTALRKETLQFPDFANLFRGGRFSYASRLEAIFDLFASEKLRKECNLLEMSVG